MFTRERGGRERWRKIGRLSQRRLKILELDWDKLLCEFWTGGHLLTVTDNQFHICHGVAQGLQFRLEHVDVSQSSKCLLEICDFW
jgi:hypothetical protein